MSSPEASIVRQFIETDTAAERFQLIGEVIGAGAVLELQATLEKSRVQWARSTTSVRKEQLEPLQLQLGRLDDQLARLDAEPPVESIEARGESARLFADAVELIGRSRLSLTEAPTTSTGLDRLIKEISGERARLERELSTIKALLQESEYFAETIGPDDERFNDLLNRESSISRDLAECSTAVEAAIVLNSRLQERQLAEQNRVTRLATMARLALEGLGEFCPVCQQTHDQEATKRHLQELITASAQPGETLTEDGRSLEQLNLRRNDLHAELEAVRALLRDARASHQNSIARQALYRTRLVDLGILADGDPTGELRTREAALVDMIRSVSSLQRRGENLTLSVIRLDEQRRRAELQQERASVLPKISALNDEIAKLDNTHSIAGKIIEALRRASLDVTRQQIESIQPLFQRIYSRIDPHPTFRLTQITTAMERGRGLLRTGVTDPDNDSEIHDALPILSSSQLNSFAASLFLALNLGLPTLKLNLVMLDDPLQSLDSINLLGLVDVLRRFREHRQIIVSTHEPSPSYS
jgi:DNA repair exonuclease SbcCD ATPase subunit